MSDNDTRPGADTGFWKRADPDNYQLLKRILFAEHTRCFFPLYEVWIRPWSHFKCRNIHHIRLPLGSCGVFLSLFEFGPYSCDPIILIILPPFDMK